MSKKVEEMDHSRLYTTIVDSSSFLLVLLKLPLFDKHKITRDGLLSKSSLNR